MAKELQRAARAAAAAFRAGGLAEAEASLETHRAYVDRALRAAYDGTMTVFGQRILDAAKAALGADATKDAEDAFLDLQDGWIRRYAPLKVVRIEETTRDEIRAAVAEGSAAGDSVAAVANRIESATGGLIGRARAVVISRTETHTAAVAAGDFAAEATGLQLRREWIAAGDERTRDTHKAADGQVVGLREPFRVGSEYLTRPGDPDGPPEETINCRCVVGHLTEDEVA